MYLLGYNQSIYYWVVELLSPTRCNYRDRERHWLPAIALSPPPFIPSTPVEDRSSRNRRDFYNSQILIPIFLSGMFLSMASTSHNPNLTKSDQTFRCLVGLTSPRKGIRREAGKVGNKFQFSVRDECLRSERKADVRLDLEKRFETFEMGRGPPLLFQA